MQPHPPSAQGCFTYTHPLIQLIHFQKVRAQSSAKAGKRPLIVLGNAGRDGGQKVRLTSLQNLSIDISSLEAHQGFFDQQVYRYGLQRFGGNSRDLAYCGEYEFR